MFAAKRVRQLTVALAAGGCLGLFAGVGAEERWEWLGDVEATASKPQGRLSINLDSLQRRSGHYEIWERIVFAPDAGRRSPDGASQAVAEHRTLWAIRCRAGEMARVTEGDDGSLAPRAESLRFYSPLPYSAGAAVIEVACGEARRRAAAKRQPAAEPLPDAGPARAAGLERPPSIADLDQLADDDQ